MFLSTESHMKAKQYALVLSGKFIAHIKCAKKSWQDAGTVAALRIPQCVQNFSSVCLPTFVEKRNSEACTRSPTA